MKNKQVKHKSFSAEEMASQYEMNLVKFLYCYAKSKPFSFFIQTIVVVVGGYLIATLPPLWWI